MFRGHIFHSYFSLKGYQNNSFKLQKRLEFPSHATGQKALSCERVTFTQRMKVKLKIYTGKPMFIFQLKTVSKSVLLNHYLSRIVSFLPLKTGLKYLVRADNCKRRKKKELPNTVYIVQTEATLST